jgi:hypothetical protein
MQSRWYLSAVLILALAGQAAAQTVMTQYGRALDANPNVTTGRYNSVRQANRAFDGNRFVTGQVTGGFHFRGAAGYSAANQLRLDLPSARLDDFIRTSAGAGQIGSERTYGPSEYLSPSRTVLAPSAITGGLNQPGSSVPRATYVPPPSARKLYDDAMAAYKPILPNTGDQLRINPLIQPQVAPDQAMSLKPPKTGAELDTRAYRPAASPLFGIVGSQDQYAPAKGEDKAEPAERPGERLRPKSRLDWQVEGVPGQSKTRPPSDKEKTQQEAPRTGPEPLPGLGQDVFLDLLRTLREAKQPDGETPAGSGARTKMAPQPVLPGVRAAEQPPGPTVPQKLVERVRGQIVIRSLAGSGRDLFNMRMSKAQKALTNGRYYDAAGHYRVAAVLNRGNPLASIGLSLALFAANEPMTSAYHLHRALSQTPPMMEPRVDVKRLLGEKVVEIRMAALESGLSEKGASSDLSLLCLAAFIRAGNDQPDKAAAHAERLKSLAEKRMAELRGELAAAQAKGSDEVEGIKGLLAAHELFVAYSKCLRGAAKAQAAPTTRPAAGATPKSAAP